MNRAIMNVKITNVFNNEGLKKPLKFKKGHGNSFLIDINGEKLLFDAGDSSRKLLKNLKLLDVSPDEISKAILSHGHYDHTRGLIGFVGELDDEKILDVYAHPNIMEIKGAGNPDGEVPNIGFPDINKK